MTSALGYVRVSTEVVQASTRRSSSPCARPTRKAVRRMPLLHIRAACYAELKDGCCEEPMVSGIMTGESERQPTREEIDQLPGPVVLEFGTDW